MVMTPKEKAIEIVEKYDLLGRDFTKGVSMQEFSKQCALVAVDEILKSNPCEESTDRGGNFQFADNTYYWTEVKKEIVNLR